jgi:hypothetical protein
LLTAALLWALGDERNLTDRFVSARLFRRQEPAGSYQAFLKMLKKWTGTLMASVVLCFRRRMQQGDVGEFLTAGFAVFAVDGSRVELPRSVSNQEAYCAKKKQAKNKAVSGKRRRQRKAGNVRKKKQRTTNRRARRRSRRGRSVQQKLDNPNAWVTTMWHVGTGLPWDWRIGPSNSSERDHLRQMIDDLPPAALVTADAGTISVMFDLDPEGENGAKQKRQQRTRVGRSAAEKLCRSAQPKALREAAVLQ